VSMPENIPQVEPLVIIGDEDLVLGFQALGFKVYSIKEKSEIKAVLEEIVSKKSLLCLVQDNIYRAAEGEINNYRALLQPIFVPFAKNEKAALVDDLVKDIKLRATGAF